MVRTKVFVGNLSFKTQESDLAKEFEVAGKVATANIITRGSRSLGYGFVEMESEEEARKAVELLSKKLIDGREINVEVAKERVERPPRAPRQPRPPRPEGANNNAAGAQGEGEGGEAAPRRRRPNQRRGPGGRKPAANADGSSPAPADGSAPREPRPRRERAPRAPRPEGERVQRTAAPNTLFVANLPFSVDDAGLAQIFAGLNLKTAHVVRKRNDRSKGFGFVEFNNEEDQKKALVAVDKKTVESRELIVKIAETPLSAPAGAPAAAPAGDQKVDAVKKESAAPAPGSPKTN